MSFFKNNFTPIYQINESYLEKYNAEWRKYRIFGDTEQLCDQYIQNNRYAFSRISSQNLVKKFPVTWYQTQVIGDISRTNRKNILLKNKKAFPFSSKALEVTWDIWLGLQNEGVSYYQPILNTLIYMGYEPARYLLMLLYIEDKWNNTQTNLFIESESDDNDSDEEFSDLFLRGHREKIIEEYCKRIRLGFEHGISFPRMEVSQDSSPEYQQFIEEVREIQNNTLLRIDQKLKIFEQKLINFLIRYPSQAGNQSLKPWINYFHLHDLKTYNRLGQKKWLFYFFIFTIVALAITLTLFLSNFIPLLSLIISIATLAFTTILFIAIWNYANYRVNYLLKSINTVWTLVDQQMAERDKTLHYLEIFNHLKENLQELRRQFDQISPRFNKNFCEFKITTGTHSDFETSCRRFASWFYIQIIDQITDLEVFIYSSIKSENYLTKIDTDLNKILSDIGQLDFFFYEAKNQFDKLAAIPLFIESSSLTIENFPQFLDWIVGVARDQDKRVILTMLGDFKEAYVKQLMTEISLRLNPHKIKLDIRLSVNQLLSFSTKTVDSLFKYFYNPLSHINALNNKAITYPDDSHQTQQNNQNLSFS